VKLRTSAKINLNLEIFPKKQDNLHTLSSVMVPINIYDYIKIEESVNETIKFIQTDHHHEVEISRFEDMDIDSVEIKVSESSKYLRKNYSIGDLPEILRLGAIIRNQKVLIPNLNTVIQSDDKLLFFLKPQHIEKVEDLFQ